jgi:hypothetical protein
MRGVLEWPAMPAAPEVTEQPARQTSAALIVAGVLMIAAGFLLANPYRGATDTRWPWQILAQSWGERGSLNWTLWFLAALLAIVLGSLPLRRFRAPVLFSLAMLLTINCCARNAGLAITQVTLGWFAGLSLLMAGFLLGAQGRAPTAARSLASLGGLLVLWTLASSFGSVDEGPLESHLVVLVRDSITRLGQGTVPGARPNYDIDLWSHAAIILASLVAVLGWLGLRGSLVAVSGLLLVLVYFLVPTFDKLGQQVGSGLDTRTVFFTLSEVLIHTGLALGVFTAAAAADLTRLESEDA